MVAILFRSMICNDAVTSQNEGNAACTMEQRRGDGAALQC